MITYPITFFSKKTDGVIIMYDNFIRYDIGNLLDHDDAVLKYSYIYWNKNVPTYFYSDSIQLLTEFIGGFYSLKQNSSVINLEDLSELSFYLNGEFYFYKNDASFIDWTINYISYKKSSYYIEKKDTLYFYDASKYLKVFVEGAHELEGFYPNKHPDTLYFYDKSDKKIVLVSKTEYYFWWIKLFFQDTIKKNNINVKKGRYYFRKRLDKYNENSLKTIDFSKKLFYSWQKNNLLNTLAFCNINSIYEYYPHYNIANSFLTDKPGFLLQNIKQQYYFGKVLLENDLKDNIFNKEDIKKSLYYNKFWGNLLFYNNLDYEIGLLPWNYSVDKKYIIEEPALLHNTIYSFLYEALDNVFKGIDTYSNKLKLLKSIYDNHGNVAKTNESEKESVLIPKLSYYYFSSALQNINKAHLETKNHKNRYYFSSYRAKNFSNLHFSVSPYENKLYQFLINKRLENLTVLSLTNFKNFYYSFFAASILSDKQKLFLELNKNRYYHYATILYYINDIFTEYNLKLNYYPLANLNQFKSTPFLTNEMFKSRYYSFDFKSYIIKKIEEDIKIINRAYFKNNIFNKVQLLNSLLNIQKSNYYSHFKGSLKTDVFNNLTKIKKNDYYSYFWGVLETDVFNNLREIEKSNYYRNKRHFKKETIFSTNVKKTKSNNYKEKLFLNNHSHFDFSLLPENFWMYIQPWKLYRSKFHATINNKFNFYHNFELPWESKTFYFALNNVFYNYNKTNVSKTNNAFNTLINIDSEYYAESLPQQNFSEEGYIQAILFGNTLPPPPPEYLPLSIPLFTYHHEDYFSLQYMKNIRTSQPKNTISYFDL